MLKLLNIKYEKKVNTNIYNSNDIYSLLSRLIPNLIF